MESALLPLGELGFGPAGHRAALAYWDAIFRRPRDFELEVRTAAPRRAVAGLCRLAVHFFPYFLGAMVLGRLFLLEVLEIPPDTPDSPLKTTSTIAILTGVCFYLGTFGGLALASRFPSRDWVRNLALGQPLLVILLSGPWNNEIFPFGYALGLSLGFAGGFAGASSGAAAVGIGVGSGGGLAMGISIGIAGGMPSGIAFGLAFGLVGGIALGIYGRAADAALAGAAFGALGGGALGIAVGYTYGLAVGLEFGLAFGLAFELVFLRAFYLPRHLFLLLARDPGKPPYGRHPLRADQCVHLPLPGLDRLLVRYFEHAPREADREVDRLIDTYPSQRRQALAARAVLAARQAARVAELAEVERALAALPAGRHGFLAQAAEVKRLAGEVSAAARRLDQAPRGYLRAPYAESLIDKIEIFRHCLAGCAPTLRAELRKAAEMWLENARARLAEARRLVPGGQFLPVFRAAEALQSEVDAYLPRQRLWADLEERLQTGGGVVLVGRRRTGKSTLLHNLAAQLGGAAEVRVISMQNARAFSSAASFRKLLRQTLESALAAELPGDRSGAGLPAAGSELAGLEALLAATDRILAERGQRLVLAIDEYDTLDAKIAGGVFPEELPLLLRDSMEAHRCISWVFAGSRSPAELAAGSWTTAFAGARRLEMPLFEAGETCELLTDPLRASPLFGDRRRPSFAAGFWGEGGTARVHEAAGGWPHLVQLLAQNAVQLVNQEGRPGLDDELFERVESKAVAEGSVVFTELLEKESRLPGEWAYLQGFRRADEQDPPADDRVARSLLHRWLLAAGPQGRYRLKVPLMRRWLRERG